MQENKLREWLGKVGAKRLRAQSLPNGDVMYWYGVDGRILIIQEYAKDAGWDVYLPAETGNNVEATLKSLDSWAAKP